jgi:hypothetical protein
MDYSHVLSSNIKSLLHYITSVPKGFNDQQQATALITLNTVVVIPALSRYLSLSKLLRNEERCRVRPGMTKMGRLEPHSGLFLKFYSFV